MSSQLAGRFHGMPILVTAQTPRRYNACGGLWPFLRESLRNPICVPLPPLTTRDDMRLRHQGWGDAPPHGAARPRGGVIPRRSRGGQPPADRIADERGGLMDVQLPHQVDPMRLDGFDAQPQICRDLLGRLPLRDALDDLTLA